MLVQATSANDTHTLAVDEANAFEIVQFNFGKLTVDSSVRLQAWLTMSSHL